VPIVFYISKVFIVNYNISKEETCSYFSQNNDVFYLKLTFKKAFK